MNCARCGSSSRSPSCCPRCAPSAIVRPGRIWKARLSAGELRDRGIFATRQLAKRQLTWLRSTPDVQAFDCLATDLATRVLAHLQEQLERLQGPGAAAMSREMTLPDYLRAGLDIVSIGINPSVYSVEKGFAFARPGNRFWPVFNKAGSGLRCRWSPHVPRIEIAVPRPRHRLHRHRQAADARGLRAVELRTTATVPSHYTASCCGTSRASPGSRARTPGRCSSSMRWTRGARSTPACRRRPSGRPACSSRPIPSGANPAANPQALLPHYVELRKLRDRLR